MLLTHAPLTPFLYAALSPDTHPLRSPRDPLRRLIGAARFPRLARPACLNPPHVCRLDPAAVPPLCPHPHPIPTHIFLSRSLDPPHHKQAISFTPMLSCQPTIPRLLCFIAYLCKLLMRQPLGEEFGSRGGVVQREGTCRRDVAQARAGDQLPVKSQAILLSNRERNIPVWHGFLARQGRGLASQGITDRDCSSSMHSTASAAASQ